MKEFAKVWRWQRKHSYSEFRIGLIAIIGIFGLAYEES
jgi:hypothetical protein